MFNFIKSIFNRESTDTKTPHTSRVWQSPRTQAGIWVTPDEALKVSTVWACVRYLSQSVGQVPWRVLRPDGDGAEVASNHPVDWILHKRPSNEWSSFQLRETLTSWALRWGNGYAEIERDVLGRPIGLHPIHPERVEPRRDADGGQLYYRIHNGAGGHVDLGQMDVFHVRGFGEGPVGVGIMAYAAESIGWARAVQLFGASYFGSGANPSAVVMMKKSMSIEGLTELERRFAELYNGPKNANKTLFLDNEMDFKALTTQPNNAQFIETNQHLVEEICRWFGVPPHKVQHMLRSTFSNIEHQAIEAVVDSIMPWVKRFEEEADFKLFGQNRQGFFTKMNLNAYLRGDSTTRANFYKTLREIGVLSANDIRRLEDLRSIGPDGDKYIMQMSYTTLEKIGEDPPQPQLPAPVPEEDDEDTDEDEQVEEVEKDA